MRAVEDLQSVREHIAADNPKAARRVVQRIRQNASRLAAHPRLGRPTEVQDIRQISVAGLPFLVPYRVRDDRVEILRVFHTARERPSKWTGAD